MHEATTDFFISYRTLDRAWAEWIAWQLEAKGYRCILQAWDFHFGDSVIGLMQDELTKAQRMIAVFSPNYFTSPYTKMEWQAALARVGDGDRSFLLPVKVAECEIPGLLKPIRYIDLVGVEQPDEARKRLLAGVEQERAKPAAEPAFPGAAPKQEEPRYPGTRSIICRVPHRLNACFTGREAEMAQMHELLQQGGDALLLHGLGGIGKTQLALAYCYAYQSEYSLIYWLRAEEAATLAGDYMALAQELGLVGAVQGPQTAQPDPQALIAAVRRWLERNRDWLLIFDNATEPAALRDFLPASETGHLLITSRNPHWAGMAKSLPVQVLAREDSIRFIKNRLPHISEVAAGEVAEQMGDLPLALAQAVDYLEATGCTARDYCDLFAKHSRQLLGNARGRPVDYAHTVATSLGLSLARLQEGAAEKEAPRALELLRLCAYLAPEAIPRDLLKRYWVRQAATEAEKAQLQVDEAVAALRDYSLIDLQGEALSLHRLVQVVVRDGLSEEERATWAATAVGLVWHLFHANFREVQEWPRCAALLPHALAAAGHARASEPVVSLLSAVGEYLSCAGRYGEARRQFEAALSRYRQTEVVKPLDEAELLRSLAQACNQGGDGRAAFEHAQAALTLYEAHAAADDTCLFAMRALAAACAAGVGESAAARLYVAQAQQWYDCCATDAAQRAEGDATTAAPLASAFSNLAWVYNNQLGDGAAALALYKRALAIKERWPSPAQQEKLVVLMNIGTILQKQGDLTAAAPYLEQALTLARKIYPAGHPSLAKCCNGVGLLRYKEGKRNDARKLYEEALQIQRDTLDEWHPDVAESLNNLGGLLGEMGDWEGGRAQLTQALGILEATGAESRTLATVLANLGRARYKCGDLAAASGHFERARALFLRFDLQKEAKDCAAHLAQMRAASAPRRKTNRLRPR